MKDVINRGEALKKLNATDILKEVAVQVVFLVLSFIERFLKFGG
jgi:hypothetical protein